MIVDERKKVNTVETWRLIFCRKNVADIAEETHAAVDESMKVSVAQTCIVWSEGVDGRNECECGADMHILERHSCLLQRLIYFCLTLEACSGLRRIKNIVIVMEWTPTASSERLRLLTGEEHQALSTVDAVQGDALARAHELLAFHKVCFDAVSVVGTVRGGSVARVYELLAFHKVHFDSVSVVGTVLSFSRSMHRLGTDSLKGSVCF